MRCAHWRPVAALTALLTAGCSTMMTGEQVSVEQVPVERDVSFHLDDCSGYAVIRNDFFSSPPPVQLKPGQWREMFSRFSEPWDPENRYFRERLAYLQSHPRHMEHILKNAQPYIFHVYREVTSAGLPVEIIAIPMIESMYNPAARSPDGYSGLWQFGSTTARNFGLAVGGGRDERFDFQKSTAAAVKYLKYLMDFFDGSWTMAVAGYNAGEGRVLNTYKGTGKKPSQIDFNTLAIPEHTKKYLHTIMAYGHYLKHADRYKVRLPGEDGAGASGASAALAHPQTVIHTIRYVSREEFDRIHGLPAGALETAVRGIEKHEAGGATVCRVDMKGEFDPYPEDPVMTGEARVRPEDTDSAVGKTVSVLAGHAQGRSRGRSGGRFSVAPQDEGEFFSSLASFEGLPPASCAGRPALPEWQIRLRQGSPARRQMPPEGMRRLCPILWMVTDLRAEQLRLHRSLLPELRGTVKEPPPNRQLAPRAAASPLAPLPNLQPGPRAAARLPALPPNRQLAPRAAASPLAPLPNLQPGPRAAASLPALPPSRQLAPRAAARLPALPPSRQLAPRAAASPPAPPPSRQPGLRAAASPLAPLPNLQPGPRAAASLPASPPSRRQDPRAVARLQAPLPSRQLVPRAAARRPAMLSNRPPPPRAAARRPALPPSRRQDPRAAASHPAMLSNRPPPPRVAARRPALPPSRQMALVLCENEKRPGLHAQTAFRLLLIPRLGMMSSFRPGTVPAFILLTFPAVQFFLLDAGASPGHLITALILRMAVVPLDPLDADTVPGKLLIQELPQFTVLHIRLLGCFPVVLLPDCQPPGDPLGDILAVGLQGDLAAFLEAGQTVHRPQEFHGVVGGEGEAC